MKDIKESNNIVFLAVVKMPSLLSFQYYDSAARKAMQKLNANNIQESYLHVVQERPVLFEFMD